MHATFLHTSHLIFAGANLKMENDADVHSDVRKIVIAGSLKYVSSIFPEQLLYNCMQL